MQPLQPAWEKKKLLTSFLLMFKWGVVIVYMEIEVLKYLRKMLFPTQLGPAK